MKLTARVKQWLIANWSVAANASDEEFRKAAGEALAAGEDEGGLSLTKMKELTTTKSDEEADEFQVTMKSLGSAVGELIGLIRSEKSSDPGEDDEDEEEAPSRTKSVKSKKGKKPAFMEEDEEEADDEEEEEAPPKKSAKSAMSTFEKSLVRMGMEVGEDDVDSNGVRGIDVRVKRAIDRYDGTKSAMTYAPVTAKGRAHPLAGRPVMDYSESGKGRVIDSASERDKAVAGSYAKFMVNVCRLKSRRLAFETLGDHDKDLLVHAMRNEKWGGASDGGDTADIRGEKLTSLQQKALIDDATSGGLEAAPIVFDDMVIQTPLLNGELFPLVNTIPIDRGRRIEGVATGTVTGGWGGVDDTAISLFNTASYVSAFDTTIFRWEGAVKIGLDFLSDTPIDFGAHLTAQYGERLLEDLDDVIATGNGTTQPEGVTVKSGTTSVAWGGATSLGNYESLRFGVTKAEHRSNLMSSAVFCGSETSYQRAKAIPVGASDARRLGNTATNGGFGGYDGYTWMDRPYKINESLGNTKVFYAILAKYRMYRRRGLTMRTSTEGDTLIRGNEMLIVCTARYGGQLERGAVAAVTSTAPA